MNIARERFSRSKRRGTNDEISMRHNEFEVKKAEYDNSYRAAFKKLIWEAEKKGKKGESLRLREEYHGYFPDEVLEQPLRMNNDKKIS
jgi:hypothetical protein